MQTSMPLLEINNRDQKKYILYKHQVQTTVNLVTAKYCGWQDEVPGRTLFEILTEDHEGTATNRPRTKFTFDSVHKGLIWTSCDLFFFGMWEIICS